MKGKKTCGKKKRGGGGAKDKPADNGAGEGGILFAAIAEAEGHGDHADDHGESGHEDGAEAGEAGFGGGGDWVSVVQGAFLGEGDDENAVGGAHAHAHDRAHESWDAERGVREEKKDDDAGEGGGEGGDDDEGIEPGLEIHDDKQVDKNDGDDEAAEEAGVRGVHGFELAANADEAAARERGSVGGDDAIDVAADGAEVAVLHVGVDIEDAANVVVIDGFHFAGAVDGSDVGEDERACRTGGGDGNVLQVLQRLDGVLRSLGDEVVAGAVLIVQEKNGGYLEAAAERVEHAVGDVAFRKAGLRGFGAVDGDFVLRVIERLLHVRVGDAGDLTEFGEDFVGYAAIPFRVRAFNLDVYRSGKAEIKDLGGDVGGEKIKSGAGKLRGQLFAELAHVGGGGVMIFVQRDEDVRIAGANQAGRIVHVVDAAVGEADVVGDGVEFAFGN